MSELKNKHCIPCEGKEFPLNSTESEKLLHELDSSWIIVENKELKKNFIFKDFNSAINFINLIAKIAESEGHHPNIFLHDYKEVMILLSTHAISGLSDNDFILASKIDDLYSTLINETKERDPKVLE